MIFEQDQITQQTAQSGRTYRLTHNGEVYEYPSVTTIINAVLPKPALVPWAYNTGLEVGWEALRNNQFPDYDSFKEWCKQNGRGPDQRKDEGSDRGIRMHEVLEEFITGKRAENIEGLDPFITQLEMFINDYAPIWSKAEYKVVSTEHGYAGQLDAICVPTKQPPRRRHVQIVDKTCCLDLKTNLEGRVYPQVHLPQVEAYRHAYMEMGGENVDYGLVLAIGEKQYQPCVSYARVDTFLKMKELYDELNWMKQQNPNKRGN